MAAKPAQEHKPPKRAYRLKVVAHEVGKSGSYATLRDVYLESAYAPHWDMDLTGFGLDAMRVADMIRWAEFHHIPVEYDPPGNMEVFFRKSKRNGDEQGVLFS
jgi:hypothetical protein